MTVHVNVAIITIEQCSVENQMGATTVQSPIAIAPFCYSKKHC